MVNNAVCGACCSCNPSSSMAGAGSSVSSYCNNQIQQQAASVCACCCIDSSAFIYLSPRDCSTRSQPALCICGTQFAGWSIFDTNAFVLHTACGTTPTNQKSWEPGHLDVGVAAQQLAGLWEQVPSAYLCSVWRARYSAANAAVANSRVGLIQLEIANTRPPEQLRSCIHRNG